MKHKFYLSTQMIGKIFFSLTCFLIAAESLGQTQPGVKIGDPFFTIYKNTQVKKKPSGLADFVLLLSEAGSKVIFLGANPENPRWQKVRAMGPNGPVEGYIAFEDLRPDDPKLQPKVLVKESGGFRATPLTIIATAATRAFTDLSLGTQEFVRQVNEEEVLAALAKLTIVEKSVTLEDVQKRNQSLGLFPLPSQNSLGVPKK